MTLKRKIINYYQMTGQINFNIENSKLQLELIGDFLEFIDEKQKYKLYDAVDDTTVQQVTVDASSLQKWDSTLVSFLFVIKKKCQAREIQCVCRHFPQGLERLLTLAFSVDRKPTQPTSKNVDFLTLTGRWGIGLYNSFQQGKTFLFNAWKSFINLMLGKSVMRQVDLAFALEDCGYRALPIVSLISFMVGLILAFVGAVQLKTFGAQIYVASLVTIGMTRIMGATMTGIIIAGRTGASYAATIGTMQVNEEVDALKTMGINPIDFLVLPRLVALTVTMPILTMWSDFMGMLGGGFVGVTMLGIPLSKYWEMSISAINLNNFWVGIFHGFVFGIITAVCGCYYGIYCGRNADSVGVATTRAVVASIVWMIIMTGIITVACEVLGI